MGLTTTIGDEFKFYLDGNLIQGVRGWDEVERSIRRDPKYMTIGVESTSPVSFVDDAKAYIESRIANEGYKIDIAFLCEENDGLGGYSELFSGFLDIVSYTKNKDEVTFDIISSSHVAQMNEESATKFRLEIETNSEVLHDGIPIRGRTEFGMLSDTPPPKPFVLFTPGFENPNVTLPYSLPLGVNSKFTLPGAEDPINAISGFSDQFIFEDQFGGGYDLDISAIEAFKAEFKVSTAPFRMDILNEFVDSDPSNGFIVSDAETELSIRILKVPIEGDFTVLYSSTSSQNQPDSFEVLIGNKITSGSISQFRGLVSTCIYSNQAIFPKRKITTKINGGDKILMTLQLRVLRIRTVFISSGSEYQVQVEPPRSFHDFNYTAESEMAFEYDLLSKTEIMKGYTPKLLLSKIYEKITGSVPVITEQSDELFIDSDEVQISTGDQVRGIDNNFITYSFDFLRDWYFGQMHKVLQLDQGKITILRYDSVFQPNFPTNKEVPIIADIGDVTDVSESLYADGLFTSVRHGSGEHEYKAINGKEEYNNDVVYTFDNPIIANELDAGSRAIRSDVFGIELLRVTQFADSVDTKEDKELFAMHVRYGRLARRVSNANLDIPIPRGGSISFRDEAYNLIFSARRMLSLRFPLVASYREVHKLANLAFSSSDKNENLIAIPYPAYDAAIRNSDLSGVALYKPIQIECSTIGINNISQLLSDGLNRYGVVKYRDSQGEKYGYIVEAKEIVTKRSANSYTLLAVPDNIVTYDI